MARFIIKCVQCGEGDCEVVVTDADMGYITEIVDQSCACELTKDDQTSIALEAMNNQLQEDTHDLQNSSDSDKSVNGGITSSA